jgi:GNAT superfamily N-acetyltransferase
LGRTELSRIVEIDRKERINVLYDQHGTQLVARRGSWSAKAWHTDGHGEHSVEAKVHELQHYVERGGVELGALASGRLVAIGVVEPHLRPGTAQLAFLHVSAPWRAAGIGSRLSEQLEQIARTAGDSDIVVSRRYRRTPCGSTSVAALSPWRIRWPSCSNASPKTCICARCLARSSDLSRARWWEFTSAASAACTPSSQRTPQSSVS